MKYNCGEQLGWSITNLNNEKMKRKKKEKRNITLDI